MPVAYAISITSRRRPPRPRASLHLRPLTCKQPKPHSEPQWVTDGQQIHTAAGSNGMLRAAGPRRWRRRRGGRAKEAARERSRSGLGALKSTGSRRRVPRSALPARAPSCCVASCELQLADAPDLGRYRPASPSSPVIRMETESRIHPHTTTYKLYVGCMEKS